ncbi:bacterio-opsin activator [Paenibacillus sp. 1P07SE]|uniref:bacterio-opsin activator n=1 Tax=Paenibacillus sp. 1P07SE TaxID=3132209 RepID=UPI0039A44AEE
MEKSNESAYHSDGMYPIIGIDQQLDSLAFWMNDPDAGLDLVSVTGIGGIGKTTLLLEMSKMAARGGAMTLWLDGQSELVSPAAFLSALELGMESEYGIRRSTDTTLLQSIVSEMGNRKTVLLIDNCENIRRLEGWLMSSFLPLLAASDSRTMLVFASRRGLALSWRTNPTWGPRLQHVPLRPFSRRQVLDYVRACGLEPSLQEEVAQLTDGHPLSLALTIDLMRSESADSARALHELPSLLSAELLQEVTSPALYEALGALALLPTAEEPWLDRLLPAPLSAAEYMALGQLSFVRQTSSGIVLHHVVARLLREDNARRRPQRYRSMRRRTLELLAEQFPTVDRRMQMRFAAHVLELYRELLPDASAYANFATRLEPGEGRIACEADMPGLERLLAGSKARPFWQSELVNPDQYEALLSAIYRSCPEGIVVVHDESGSPLAFCAGLRLHKGTVPLMDQFAPGWRVVFGDESEELAERPAELADTLFVLLAAVDVSRRLYTAEELGALLMQQWLISLTDGLRGIALTADPHLHALLPQLGFRENGPLSISQSSEEQLSDEGTALKAWVLDFRQAAFHDWVQQVIQHSEATDVEETMIAEGAAASVASIERQIQSSAVVTGEEMKLVLEHLFEADRLGGLSLLRRWGLNGPAVRELVVEMLQAAVPTPPLSKAEQQLLYNSYIRREANKNELAAAFHMSRSTLYRHTKAAIRHCADVLSQRLFP